VGVIVALDVLVNAGKINVNAGNGTSVVVGVTEGVKEGVNV
jgi:DNA-binding GntR family transcriptional regulator